MTICKSEYVLAVCRSHWKQSIFLTDYNDYNWSWKSKFVSTADMKIGLTPEPEKYLQIA